MRGDETTTSTPGPAAQIDRDLLRFLTCGSVDDGKSTLIGRLMYDAGLIFDDQLEQVKSQSVGRPTGPEGIDFSLFVDGLEAEREQGITIDVAYRFFNTDKRKFIVADTPGHEQYTRNMATGASNSDLAVLLIDARKGILTQTRRHSLIVSLLGIKTVVLAVNKMDLVGYDEATYRAIEQTYSEIAGELGLEVTSIPVSAMTGDNLAKRYDNTGWYDGPTLLEFLEQAAPSIARQSGEFRLPVQWVNRPNLDFRGFSGTVLGAPVSIGDEITVAGVGQKALVKDLVTFNGSQTQATPGTAITLVLDREIDVSRGDVLVPTESKIEHADQLSADLIWMDSEHLLPGRPYLLQLGPQTANATVSELKYKVDINSGMHEAAKVLEMNEIGRCNISLDRAINFDAYDDNREMGGFILIDRTTNATVAAGLARFPLRRASNIVWHQLEVSKTAHGNLKGQKPCVLWFTGLSGAGKSTVANLVEKRLHSLGRHTYTLDGDNVRHGLNRDLGFTDADRVENIRRVGEVSRLFVDAGLITLVSFISPFKSERELARSLVEEDEFLEIFVDASLEVCESRDPKGLYAKAREGLIKNFTGIDQPYEAPENPEIHLDSGKYSAEELAEQVVDYLKRSGHIQLPI
ncbi:sulfate adenylyltransferase subunit CysN [Rhodovibrionaceae bacterium A322]